MVRWPNYLRVGFSILCMLACIGLSVLWLRSYRWSDDFITGLTGSREFIVHSMRGTTAWYIRSHSGPSRYWTIESESVELLTQGIQVPSWHRPLFKIQLFRRPILLPHWMFVMLWASLSAAPWVRWSRRFSLRTLLIAMTMVAIGLGIFTILS